MTDQETSHQELVNDELIEHAIDRLSLEQALRDFEIANVRVTDLTQRLISANDELLSIRGELALEKESFRDLLAQHEAMKGSAAFRLASKIWAVRNLLRG